MAPENRKPDLVREIPQCAVDSAVLALLTPVNEGACRNDLLDWQVLLIRRNTYPGLHSGQIALPGGKREKRDVGLWDTACREAHEEVGIQPGRVDKIAPLSSVYVPPSNFAIHPFVAVNANGQSFHADPREVAGMKNIPVWVFNPEKAVTLQFTSRDGGQNPAPAWRFEGFTIWGATAMILAELFRLIDEGALVRS